MIAISYRREDSLPIAGRLYDRLQTEFGKGNVFMDFDSIPYGVDFREQIKQMIDQSKLVIALIGPAWLGERGNTPRRIDEPNDFVRLEIAYALQREIPIIPVLINNASMPGPEKLPDEIERLAFRNAVTLDTGIDFHHHADRLIAGIHKVIEVAKPSAPAISRRQPIADRAPRQKIIIWSTAIFLAGIAALATWFLAGHRRELTYESTQALVAKTKVAETQRPAWTTAEQTQATPGYIPIPNGYSVLEFTVSPNRRYGVIAPDADHYIEGAFQHQVVELPTGRTVGLIQADTGFVDSKVHMGRGGINPARWSENSSVLLWEVEGRWSPRALALLKIADSGATIKWQIDLLKVAQREILSRTKRASPDAYAKAVEMNKGNGSAFPDGFVVNVRAKTPKDTPVTFPVPIHAGLTSNPKGLEVPQRAVELNSELDGVVDDDGKFSVNKFGLSNKPGWQIAVPPENLPSPEVIPLVTPPPKSKRNSFGMIEGKYLCQYSGTHSQGERHHKGVDEKSPELVLWQSTNSNYFMIKGTQFTLLNQHEEQPTPAGRSRGMTRSSNTIQWDGTISSNGDSIYTFKPHHVALVEKTNTSDSETSIGKFRKNLPIQKWTVRYEDGRLVQADGEIWTLVK